MLQLQILQLHRWHLRRVNRLGTAAPKLLPRRAADGLCRATDCPTDDWSVGVLPRRPAPGSGS